MSFDFSDITILIAEDEEYNQYFFLEIFRTTKAKVLMAGNGLEAIEYVKNSPGIDIALLDIRLPVIDGLKAAVEIRKINTSIPLIAQTAYSDPKDRKEAIQAGFDAFISKPINKDELFSLIKSLLTDTGLQNL